MLSGLQTELLEKLGGGGKVVYVRGWTGLGCQYLLQEKHRIFPKPGLPELFLFTH